MQAAVETKWQTNRNKQLTRTRAGDMDVHWIAPASWLLPWWPRETSPGRSGQGHGLDYLCQPISVKNSMSCLYYVGTTGAVDRAARGINGTKTFVPCTFICSLRRSSPKLIIHSS